jgi:hypothetical protein
MREERPPRARAEEVLAEEEVLAVGRDRELCGPTESVHGVDLPAEPAEEGATEKVRLRVEGPQPDETIEGQKAVGMATGSRQGVDEAPLGFEAARP